MGSPGGIQHSKQVALHCAVQMMHEGNHVHLTMLQKRKFESAQQVLHVAGHGIQMPKVLRVAISAHWPVLDR